MKSFITNVKNLYKMDTENIDDLNFHQEKRHLVIPKYQREYQWTKGMVETLLFDIRDSKKFLGIIILDQKENSYEVVDGQQRLTTCFLLLAALFNYYEGEELEQKAIEGLLVPYESLALENKSVGEYLVKQNEKYELNFTDEADIFFQKETFISTWETINDFLEKKMSDYEDVRSFKNKFYKCNFLILINVQHENDSSVEQVFLDINEKSQLLDPAAIFKGHCFEIFETEYHEILKQKWIEIKKAAKRFEVNFKYKNISWFLYMYLLGKGNIKEDLSLPNGGRHYLHGKTMDQTNRLLDAMIAYGKNNVEFYDECKREDYYFETVCVESYQHRNTAEPKMMRKMSTVLLECVSSVAQYQKVPFLYFIAMRDRYKNEITHEQTKRILSNLFTYAILFTLSSERKSKADMDRTVINYFSEEEPIQELVSITKTLRKNKVDEFSMISNGNKFEKLADVYSIMDFYSARQGLLTDYYSFENRYNLEHLVQNDNDSVEWLLDGNVIFKFKVEKNESRDRKKKTINYVLINEDLNGSLRSYDIVTKIKKIREWHEKNQIVLPRHLDIIISSIEAMDEYMQLVRLKNICSTDQNMIKQKYQEFWIAYFDSANEEMILQKLSSELKNSFL